MRQLLALLIGCCLALQIARADDVFVLGPGDTVATLAKRLLPAGAKMVEHPVTGDFGAAAGSVVVMYQDGDSMRLHVMVLQPQDNGFRRVAVPDPERSWSVYAVKGVLFPRLKGAAHADLCILTQMMTGIGPTGAVPFSYALLYHWDGHTFVEQQKLEDALHLKDTTTPATLQGELKRHGYL